MLSALQNNLHNNSALESSKNMAVQYRGDNSWKESFDDVVTVGTKQWMSHKDRYEYVKNRTYSKVKLNKTQK